MKSEQELLGLPLREALEHLDPGRPHLLRVTGRERAPDLQAKPGATLRVVRVRQTPEQTEWVLACFPA